MTRRNPIAAAMLEDRGPGSLDSHVRRLLADLGLFGYHTRNSRGCEPGWPDWVIVGNRILYRELKTEDGSLSQPQRDVGARLTAAGADWAVWRPRNLLAGEIARELAAIAPGVQAELFT